jgi:hypothetical protein
VHSSLVRHMSVRHSKSCGSNELDGNELGDSNGLQRPLQPRTRPQPQQRSIQMHDSL